MNNANRSRDAPAFLLLKNNKGDPGKNEIQMAQKKRKTK